MKNTTLAVFAAASFTASAVADTTLLRPDVYLVDEGVAFGIANDGASDFLFSWTDASGTFADIADPTIILVAGQTYTFTRTSGMHPFVITDDTLPVSGSDGSYVRDTQDGDTIDDATLKPIADFTADPAPTDDFISWTPAEADAGTYYYTCRVTGHTGMAGRIRVVPSCYADYNGDGDVNTLDVLAFLNEWNAGLLNADVNLDGDINTLDVLEFLNQWNAGC
jgi:plastocyanin